MGFFRLLALIVLLPLAACVSATAVPQQQPQKRIALSFDDVPRAPGGFFTPEERTEMLIQALAQAKVAQAAFFVTTGNLERPFGTGGEERIGAYVAAGHVIGNHSHSHKWLSRTSVDDYVADLDRAEAWLKDRPGHRPWYRFPFLNEGGKDLERRDAVRAALGKRGLRNAYVTIDNYDWHLDALAARAMREDRVMNLDALRDLYVETLVDTANFYDRIALETLQRSPAHMLLLHETDLAALFIPDLVAALRADGWEIVTADEAYRDPIAAVEPDTWFLGEGRVSALAQIAGRAPAELVHERTDEGVLARLFEERVLQAPVTD